MREKTRSSLAPSIRAACPSSLGMVRKAPRMTQMARGRKRATYGRTSPSRVFQMSRLRAITSAPCPRRPSRIVAPHPEGHRSDDGEGGDDGGEDPAHRGGVGELVLVDLLEDEEIEGERGIGRAPAREHVDGHEDLEP